MLAGLQLLVNRVVSAVEVREPAYDLDLIFDGGLRVRIFCDRVSLEDGDDNYCLFLPDKILAVGTRSQLSKEQRFE